MPEQVKTKDDLPYWIAFNRIPQIGPARFGVLRKYFPDMRSAWRSSLSELKNAGLSLSVSEEFVRQRKLIDPERELEKIHKHSISVVTINDDEYPETLKEIHNPPYLLYYRGAIKDERDAQAIAIVGTRKITTYGSRVTEDISRGLTNRNCSIVSGLALGVDSVAHTACLASGGRTIAVLANGLESVYPTSHTQLANRIISSGGLILSEFPIGTKSFKSNFPQRNRIISGLAMGTLIVEAAEKSGSLITAKHALEQNREVFAVPGSVFSATSSGPHLLISQGATLVTSADDIIASLNMQQSTNIYARKEKTPDDPLHEEIYSLIGNEPIHTDDIVKQSKLDARKIHSILVTMELKGYLKDVGGGHYVRL